MFIFFWSSNVYLSMADIKIATSNNFFTLVSEFVDIMDKMIIKFQFITQHFSTISSFSSVGEVYIQKSKILKLCLNYPSFFMKMFHRLKFRYSRNKFQILFIKSSDSRISWFFTSMSDSIILSHMIAKFWRQLRFKRFYFLNTDNIWITLFDPFVKSLANDSTYSIYISRSDFHTKIFMIIKILLMIYFVMFLDIQVL